MQQDLSLLKSMQRRRLPHVVEIRKILLLGLLGLTLLSGCASTGDRGSFNMVVKEETPLNEMGPMQTTPSDIKLRPGMRVRAIQSSGNYIYVETVNGDRGFVPADALRGQGAEE